MRDEEGMRADEERCKHAVDLFLRELRLEPEWEGGTRKKAPDYFVSVKKSRFAVEVTSIHGSTILDGKQVKLPGLTHKLQQFADMIVREVELAVRVPGIYTIEIPSMPKMKEKLEEIVRSLVQYFKNDADRAKMMAERVVYRHKGRNVSLRMIKNEGCALVPFVLPTGALVTHGEDQLKPLLEKAFREKVRKLREIAEPWVLVIEGQYGFQRSMEEWRERLPDEASKFAAIFRVQDGKAQLVSGAL